MNTILYRIPDRFFPGVRVTEPFHAKINFEVKNGQVIIHDVRISANCMERIHNMNALRWQMQQDIEAAIAKNPKSLDTDRSLDDEAVINDVFNSVGNHFK